MNVSLALILTSISDCGPPPQHLDRSIDTLHANASLLHWRAILPSSIIPPYCDEYGICIVGHIVSVVNEILAVL